MPPRRRRGKPLSSKSKGVSKKGEETSAATSSAVDGSVQLALNTARTTRQTRTNKESSNILPMKNAEAVSQYRRTRATSKAVGRKDIDLDDEETQENRIHLQISSNTNSSGAELLKPNESFDSQAISSSALDEENMEGTSEDHVSAMLHVTENSLQLVVDGAEVNDGGERSNSAVSSQPLLSFSLPPSSPPVRLSSAIASPAANPIFAPLRRILGRPARRPVHVEDSTKPSGPTVAKPESSPSYASDPFGFFATEQKLQAVKAVSAQRLVQCMEKEAEILAEEPSVHLPEGLAFVSPDKKSNKSGESELSSVDDIVRPMKRKNVAERVPSDSPDEFPQRNLRHRGPQHSSESANTTSSVELAALLPKRRTRAKAVVSAKPSKREQEKDNGKRGAKGKTVSRPRKEGKVGEKKEAKAKHSKAVQEEHLDSDIEAVPEMQTTGRQRRLAQYKDLESYDLEEELVVW